MYKLCYEISQLLPIKKQIDFYIWTLDFNMHYKQHPCLNTIFARKDKSLQNTMNNFFHQMFGAKVCNEWS
jgi:hypothetical protein